MLQLLRQFRRRLAGTFGLLVTGVWLAMALAPCTASADSTMEAHCPHCDVVESPCADAMPDCDIPVSLAPVESDTFKHLKLVALPSAPVIVMPASATGPPAPSLRNVDPPHPPFTDLFCRYQE